MREAEIAVALAIAQTKRRGLPQVGPDQLLLGCLQAISQFGIAQIGSWSLDLEELGVDWLHNPDRSSAKVAYSAAVVTLLDLAAAIARANGPTTLSTGHLLAAFANETSGLMGDLKQQLGITSAGWRAAISQLASTTTTLTPESSTSTTRDFLTPEEAADALGIHVQTLRGYVRSGKLPALRLAGERSLRIRRSDLEAVLEPLQSTPAPTQT